MSTDHASQPPPLYLASRSPRRALLLREQGFEARVVESGIDDALLAKGNVTAAQWAAALAILKARAAEQRLRERGKAQGLVLAADTIVERQGEIIGQPRDADDARRILFVLRDVRHAVITAVALLDLRTDECILFADTAHVEVGHIADEQIEEYIAGGAWRGKAGAYNLSERLEAGWPIRYEGDPGTIMGLPMRRLAPLLRRWVA